MPPPADLDRDGHARRHLVVVREADGSLRVVQPGHLGADLVDSWPDGRTAMQTVNDVDRAGLCLAVGQILSADRTTASTRARILGASGRWHHCDITLVGLGPADARRVLIRVRDATRDHRHDIGNRLDSQILAHLPSAVVAVDDGGVVLYWNRQAEVLFGASADDVLGRRIDTLTDRILPDDDLDHLLEHLDHHEIWEGGYTIRRPDGSTCPASLQIRITDTDAHGFTGLIATATDATERAEASAEDALRSLHDPLTGLPTRALFVEQLDQALRRRPPSSSNVAVARIDIDGFHRINDEHGIDVGDAVLVAVAERLAGRGAPGSVAARVAGDGFALFAERVNDVAGLDHLGDQVLALFSAPVILGQRGGHESFGIDSVEIDVRASVGVAVSVNGEGPETLLRNAEAALVTAKAHGGACVRRFDDALHRTITKGVAEALRLRAGLDAGELEVWFQPIVEVATGGLAGFEALARWRRDGTIVAPGEFIPVAEQHGLIGRIGALAREAAAEALAAWSLSPQPLFVAVNVSPLELDTDLVDQVTELLARGRFPRDRMVIEITESLLVDGRSGAPLLDQLRSLGIAVAIDDVGTGYSSLARLVEASVDELKIDRSFIEHLDRDTTSRAVTAALIGLANEIGIRVIAEGVETETQRTVLHELGCGLAQGFLWSPPVPRAEADEMVRLGQANGSANGSATPADTAASPASGR